ncbi:Zn-ribbon domain-containing protein [Nanoarchaeota archaeon]
MPHQCVRCSTLYDDGSDVILNGCSCGAKLFFFIKKEKLEESKETVVNLSDDQKDQIEKDVFEMMGSDIDSETPVVLDLESIKILQPGKYQLDLVNLFKKDPLVFRLDEGKYVIDLVESFKNLRKK